MSRGRAAAYKQTHARIMLLSDESQECGAMKDEEIARALRVGEATVGRVRRRCVEEGVEAALGRREQANHRPRKLDGQGEVHLTHLACTNRRSRALGCNCWLTGWCNVRWTASAPKPCAKR